MSLQPDSSPTRVVLVGAGDQGRVTADILLAAAEPTRVVPIGFVDDAVSRIGRPIFGLPVIGPLEHLSAIPHDAVVVAIGDNEVRERISLDLEAKGERFVTARHPFSSVALGVEIGPGCIISAGVVIAASARVGRGVLVNTNASIDHDTVIEDFAHLGPRVVVGGRAQIGVRALVGLGASVMSGRRIGRGAIVGAGALVVRHLPATVVAIGVPARVRR